MWRDGRLRTLAGVSDVQGTPDFVNAAGGDYHLRPDSQGVDYAPADSNISIDLDDRPRDVDLDSVPNIYGPRDLGAYERQNAFFECGASDSIFCDGFDH